MKTKIVTMAMLALGLVGVLSGTARAQVYVWHSKDFTGPMKVFGSQDATYTNDRFPNGWRVNDAVTAICNYTNQCVRFYWNSNYSGPNFGMRPWTCYASIDVNRRSNFSSSVYNFNDDISSHKPSSELNRPSCEMVRDY